MDKQTKQTKLFNDFTNLYELSKTLRFELKPVGNTQKMLEENKVFEKDQLIQQKYEKVKPYFDRLHREFVKQALGRETSLNNLEQYEKVLDESLKDKRNKVLIKKLEKEESRLRKEVATCFDELGKIYSNNYPFLKNKNINFLFEESVFKLLKELYGNEEETKIIDTENSEKFVSIFDEWKGFTGYFSKFYETRKNFYKDDATSTAIAYRIVNQNLKRFCENLLQFEKIKNKINFSEVENNFSISIEKIFELNYYNCCLLQDGIDLYNKIIGGETLVSGEKKKGVNELVNQYHQNNKGEKLPFLKTLDKQILSEKDKLSFGIESDAELLEKLKEFYKNSEEKISFLRSLIIDFTENKEKYNSGLKNVYISKEAFNTISYKWTRETHLFEQNLYNVMQPDNLFGLEYDKDEESYKFPDFIPVSYIKMALDNIDLPGNFWKEKYYESESGKEILNTEEILWGQFLKILNYEFKSLFKKEIENGSAKSLVGYDVYREKFSILINADKFELDKNAKIIIKDFADSVKWIYQMGKYFAVEKKRAWVDGYEIGDFYTNPDFGYRKFYDDTYEQIVKFYDELRNYLTKKPWEDLKWKLNFENSTLANGWDVNKEIDNYAVILRKKNKYYLGLMKKGKHKIFEKIDINKTKGELYEKMIYKYFPEASKMIPKCSTQLKSVKSHFAINSSDYELYNREFIFPVKISKKIFELNNNYYYKDNINEFFIPKDEKEKKLGVKKFQKEYFTISQNREVYKNSLHDWIEFCINFLKSYKSTSIFDYSKLKNIHDYKTLDEFYSDINLLTYNISFVGVDSEYVDRKNKDSEFYLFEIFSQDFASGKTGKKNLHTLYFEQLFSKENCNFGFPLKLNGQAEIFYRPKSIKLEREKRSFTREIVNKKRYTGNKIFFHCPITLNRGVGDVFQFNKHINNYLANNSNINIIGIDRGEKHLAYYTVMNQQGQILDNGSLNFIQSKNKNGQIILKNGKRIEEIKNEQGEIIDYRLAETGGKVEAEDYKLLLEYKEKKRKIQRQTWQEVEGIKELKKGYISQVVRKIADLAIQHNAIIVFEDLNMRFKQIRGGIERSVYQQLEKALIEKLNYLANKKESDSNKAGHILRAYQLTPPFDTFKNMGKQTGIIFYTQADYTSVTDPVTGFRKNVYISNSTPIEKIKKAIEKFKEINWDEKVGSYYFKYDAKDFNKNENGESSEWVICAKVPRIRREKKNGYWEHKKVNPNEMLEELFTAYGFKLKSDILSQIKEKDIKGELGEEKEFDGKKRNFYKSLIYIFNLILQVRNSKPETDGKKYIDFIASPVYPFFATGSEYSEPNFLVFKNMFLQNSDDQEEIIKEFNGDANGSFNIARKGLIILRKINDWKNKNEKLNKEDKENKNYPDLFIPFYEWDKFTQSQFQIKQQD